jgi:hypothetical protein
MDMVHLAAYARSQHEGLEEMENVCLCLLFKHLASAMIPVNYNAHIGEEKEQEVGGQRGRVWTQEL